MYTFPGGLRCSLIYIFPDTEESQKMGQSADAESTDPPKWSCQIAQISSSRVYDSARESS